MLIRQKKQISGQQPSSSSVSDSTPQSCLWRRPPSTPPLTLRTQKLIAWQPSTDLLMHGSLKGKGHGSDVRDSWPSALKTIYDLKPGKTQSLRSANHILLVVPSDSLPLLMPITAVTCQFLMKPLPLG